MEVLNGFKTYIVAAMLLALGVLGMIGIDIPGVPVPDDWITLVLGALGLGSLRAGVAKSGP